MYAKWKCSCLITNTSLTYALTQNHRFFIRHQSITQLNDLHSRWRWSLLNTKESVPVSGLIKFYTYIILTNCIMSGINSQVWLLLSSILTVSCTGVNTHTIELHLQTPYISRHYLHALVHSAGLLIDIHPTHQTKVPAWTVGHQPQTHSQGCGHTCL